MLLTILPRLRPPANLVFPKLGETKAVQFSLWTQDLQGLEPDPERINAGL